MKITTRKEPQWYYIGRRAQVSELSSSLRDIPFTRVLTSPRQLARRTFELAGLGPAAEINADLAKLCYGDYEGQRSPYIRRPRRGDSASVRFRTDSTSLETVEIIRRRERGRRYSSPRSLCADKSGNLGHEPKHSVA
jgi:hypothetical protein